MRRPRKYTSVTQTRVQEEVVEVIKPRALADERVLDGEGADGQRVVVADDGFGPDGAPVGGEHGAILEDVDVVVPVDEVEAEGLAEDEREEQEGGAAT